MKVYTIQINYKSGTSMKGDFKKFSVDEFGTYSWETYGLQHGPLIFGANNIESVWQLGYREVEDIKE